MAKSAVKEATTKKPSGLEIKRNDDAFTATWKIADKNYDWGQTLEYRINSGKWIIVPIGVKATSKKFLEINYAQYHPTVPGKYLKTIEVRLQGRRSSYEVTKKGTTTLYRMLPSKWAYYTYTFKVPSNPTLTATPTEEVQDECTFTWNVSNPSDKPNKVSQVIWSSRLLRNSNITDGAKAFAAKAVESSNGSGGATGSYKKSETYTPTADTSYTRWFAAIARGPKGNSEWKYTKYVYGMPYKATVDKATIVKNNSSGYTCTMSWRSAASASHPITLAHVYYTFVVPGAGMTCPSSGVTWTEAGTVRDNPGSKSDPNGTNTITFSTAERLDEDEVMFVRVDNEYEKWTSIGYPKAAAVGYLADPKDLEATAYQATHTATVACDNDSDVPDSELAVKYMTDADPNGFVIGIIEHGASSVSLTCPAWDVSSPPRFGVFAFVGSYVRRTRSDGVYDYKLTTSMRSKNTIEDGGLIPAAPTGVTVTQTDTPGTVRVIFDWSWAAATVAELSWADHEDAWESTDEPNTYEIPSPYTSAWNVSGLDAGVRWYFRVRLAAKSGNDLTYGGYSDITSIDLSSAPAVPILTLSKAIITADESLTASWVYVATDSTNQADAVVAEVTESGSDTVIVPIVYAGTAQYVNITPEEAGWNTGETHRLVVKVVSASNHESEWSEPVSVTVADPLTATITQTSLVEETITTDGNTRVIESLKGMPLTITVEGAGDDGTTTIAIVRAADYRVDRPDESQFNGYEGETIALYSQVGEAQITIDRGMLYGHLDDGASYTIIATVQDGLGQSAEASIDFEVHWTNQAIIPSAIVEYDEDELIAILEPVAPTGTRTGDVCDIYRLSVDRPELIYPSAVWGTQYVDPYPTIGEYGGYRFVYRSADGDYITDDNEFAWYDFDEDYLECPYNIIDFGTGQIRLSYNVDLSNSWKKDFQETQYLGGSTQGDWNPAVSRTASVNSVAVTTQDQGTIETMRRLATYAGICHVRTKDGSSYAADVQVSEDYKVDEGHKLASFTLKITRVDPEEYDGVTLAEWESTHPEEA